VLTKPACLQVQWPEECHPAPLQTKTKIRQQNQSREQMSVVKTKMEYVYVEK
jgi:hypothetical protein